MINVGYKHFPFVGECVECDALCTLTNVAE